MADIKMGDWNLYVSGLDDLKQPLKLESITFPRFAPDGAPFFNSTSALIPTFAPVDIKFTIKSVQVSKETMAVADRINAEHEAASLKEAKHLVAKARRDAKGPPPIRAFEVLETDERTGAIYFARHAIQARKAGANEYGGGELYSVTSRRVPWADRYADTGFIPAGHAVQNGWHFECANCGRRIDEDNLAERGLRTTGVIGYMEGPVYCRARCAQQRRARERMRKRRSRAAVLWLRGLVRKRFGKVRFVNGQGHEHTYVTDEWIGEGRSRHWQIGQAFVSFEFPGQKIGPASLRYDTNNYQFRIGPQQPEFSCCTGDLEAFEAWAEATRISACMVEEVRA